jgi:outer membrane protein TolC
MRFIVFTLGALTAVVSAASAVRPLTLDEAESLAVANSKQVEAARQGLKKAQAQVSEALGYALPTLNLSAVYTRNVQLPVFFIPDFSDPGSGRLNAVTVGLDNQYNVGVQASQILFNSAVFIGIGASRMYNAAARANLRGVIATVVTDTRKRFYGALLAKEFLAIANATLTNGQSNLENIQILFKEGLVAEFDAIRAEVAVDNIKPIVTQAEAGYANAIGALLTYMGVSMSDSVEPVGVFPTELQDVGSEDETIRKAFENNYDLAAMDLQTQVSREFVTVNQGDYYPTIAAFGNWMNQGQSATFNNWLSASSAGVGLQFQMNIFNGMRTKAKVEQSQADYETVRVQAAQLKDGIRLQVRTFMNLLKSAKARYDGLQRTVRQAERGREIAQIRYREGTGSLLEINDADLALAQARTNTVQALHDYHVARVDLERAVGGLDAQYFASVPRD